MGHGEHGHEALDRMRSLATEWDAVGDRRALFADAYGRMTQATLAAIDDGAFADGAWVGRLLDRFAEYYFVALEGHEPPSHDGHACPAVWHEAFEAGDRDDLHELQVLMLGINAHINHDLAFALADVLWDWPMQPPDVRARRLADHLVVNDVIARLIDSVQAEVVAPRAPVLATVDRLLGPADEWVFARLISSWRGHVWSDAQGLMHTQGPDHLRCGERIHGRSIAIARLIRAV